MCMKKGVKKLTAILLAMMMGLSFTYTSYPVYAQENIETTGTSSEQTENSVAKVGDTYYDDLGEALNSAKGKTCDILKDANLTGTYVFDHPNDAVTINLNGYTISGDATLKLGGVVGSQIVGPGTINANIHVVHVYFNAPLTINGNITSGVCDFIVNGSGILRVNGNIDEFILGYRISEGAKVICTGTHPEHPSITSPLDGNELIKEPSNLQGIAGQKLSTVSLPQDWSWANGETELTSGTQTYTARFDTTNYETEYDFTNVVGYNKDQHYVERELTVNVGEAIAKVVKPDGTEVFYSDIVDAFAGAENSTLYLLDNVEYDRDSDPQERWFRPANNMTLDTNGYMLITKNLNRAYSEGNPNFHIIGNGNDKTAVKITNMFGHLTTTVSNAKIEVHNISRGSMYVKSDSSVVAINREDGTKPKIEGTATKLYLEEGADLIGEFRLLLETNTIYTNVQPDKSKYKLEVPTTLELGKTYQLDLSEVFLNHSDIVNKGKMDVSISGMDESGYITMKNGNDIAYLPISIKDIDSLTNDTVILNAEHRDPEKDKAQYYNGNGHDSTSLTIGDKLIKDISNPNGQEKPAHGTYTGTLKIKNNIDDTVKEITVVHEAAHSYKEEWVKNETNHWHECECGAKSDEAAHTFKWVIDKKATKKEKGSKHEECSVCGYKKASVEIPVVTSNTEKPDTDKPTNEKGRVQTGDQTNVGVFVFMLIVSALGIAVLAILKKRSIRK